MNDDEIRALAAEALTIARRLHADRERLGQILSIELHEIATPHDEERWRQRVVFSAAYFGWDVDDPDEAASWPGGQVGDQYDELWCWALAVANGGWTADGSDLPPLPVSDELDRYLHEEGFS